MLAERIFGRRRALLLSLVLSGMFAALAHAGAPEVNLGHFNKLAMNGYDVMTYWKGGKFLENPAKYAPQYGGYCAYAASRNAVADVDPFAWRIWKDKLYLNYSPRVRRQWASDIDENIAKADGFWPKLLENE